MAHAKSEESFHRSYIKAENLLRQRCKDSHLKINDLREVYDQRLNFASYSIRGIKSSRGRIGSSSSESNHSSILVNLNNGKRGINKYTEHPTTFFKDLLLRQSYHIQKWNEQLFNENRRMNIEIALIEQSSPVNNDLLEVARYMCFKSYQRFKKNWNRANNNYTLQKGLEVHYLENDTSKPIIFEQYPDGTFSPCVCNDKKAFEEQCVHEIVVYRQKFKKNLFAKWHMRRESITCSPSPHSKNDFVGHCKEVPTATEWITNRKKGPNPFNGNASSYIDSKECNLKESGADENQNVSDFNEDGLINNDETYTPCSQLKVSSSTMHKLSGEFIGNWNKASEETQTKVFAIYLELNSLLMFDGKNPSMKMSPDRAGSVDKMLGDIVVNYQKSFLGKSGNFKPCNLSLKLPHKNILQKQSKSRLKPIREIEAMRFKRVKKSITTCTFCKEPGHQRTNCNRRIALQNQGTEYTMNNDVGIKIHFRSLINELESHSNIEPMNYNWEVSLQLDSRQGFRRMIIENAYSAVNQVDSISVPLNSMYFRITFLDKNAHAIIERVPTIISGDMLKFYLRKACEKVTPIYIYNKCALGRTSVVKDNAKKRKYECYNKGHLANCQLSPSKQNPFLSPGIVSPYTKSSLSPGLVSPSSDTKSPKAASTYTETFSSPGIESTDMRTKSQIGLYAEFLSQKKGGHRLEAEFNSNMGSIQSKKLHFDEI